jgi:hypothetical protein
MAKHFIVHKKRNFLFVLGHGQRLVVMAFQTGLIALRNQSGAHGQEQNKNKFGACHHRYPYAINIIIKKPPTQAGSKLTAISKSKKTDLRRVISL